MVGESVGKLLGYLVGASDGSSDGMELGLSVMLERLLLDPLELLDLEYFPLQFSLPFLFLPFPLHWVTEGPNDDGWDMFSATLLLGMRLELFPFLLG